MVVTYMCMYTCTYATPLLSSYPGPSHEKEEGLHVYIAHTARVFVRMRIFWGIRLPRKYSTVRRKYHAVPRKVFAEGATQYLKSTMCYLVKYSLKVLHSTS